MTTALDTKFGALAEKLLLKFGISSTYTAKTGASYQTSRSYTGTPTTHTVLMTQPVPLASVLGPNATVEGASGVIFMARQKGELVSGSWVDLTFTPANEETVQPGSAGPKFQVVKVERYQPGNDVSAWALYVK